MDGLAFERYVIILLARRGFYNVILTEQYDIGVDGIASKDGVRWGMQVKRYSGMVKVEAVRRVATAFNHYKCERAIVITKLLFKDGTATS